MRQYILLAFISTLFFGCTKKTFEGSSDIDFTQLDTMVISADKPNRLKTAEEFEIPNYNASSKRKFDLVHTVLELDFDWPNQHVNGIASLMLSPYFYSSDKVELDAKGFDIHKIEMGPRELEYEYDGEKITVDLGRVYNKGEEFIIGIYYTAKPVESAGGGSAAIMSDQGLFFINHDGSDPDKPMQIWTQGETEWNSRWFPTIDKPNERCTQEMILTVDDKFKTLSNGVMTSSNKNADGTRTDSWKMDLPHAPYLFMLAIGEFAVVKEEWRGIPIEYYVEPEYENDAKAIFAHTLEMLDFFSDKLGVEYPWPKYSQVVVKDFVSGAMENTTGTIFGDFVQLSKRDLIDNNNDKIVAHEMFHHWFGDLVTCESWANLTMNEGFANYSEYLWYEYKYGRDAGDYHWLEESRGYFGEARQNIHPLIYYGYRDKEDMFDQHSYNKGGCIIHMLRHHVGDDAFWKALNLYLTENKFNSVEAHDLRLSFEEITGEDLNWFFDQWFFKAGHPLLKIDRSYDIANKELTLYLEQTQNTDRSPPIFQLPISLDIYTGASNPERHNIWMDERVQEFKFKVDEEPAWVNVDAERILLLEREESKSTEEYIFQYKNGKKFMDRYEALEELALNSSTASKSAFKLALKDDFWAVRGLAVQNADMNDPAVEKMVEEMATKDHRSQVRSSAVVALAGTGDKKYVETFKQVITNEQAYPVIASALESLVSLDKEEALANVGKLKDVQNEDIINSIGVIYLDSGDPKYLPYFVDNMEKVDGYAALDFITNYLRLAVMNSSQDEGMALTQLRELALDGSQSLWRKYGATKTMHDLMTQYKMEAKATKEEGLRNRFEQTSLLIQGYVAEIKRSEKNKMLVNLYGQF